MTDNQTTSNPEDTGSSDDFFNALDNDVNGAIQDEQLTSASSEATPPKSDPEQVTHESEGSKNETDWEKRYKDSTREAQKMHTELSGLKPFVPVLEAMKNDSGLVDHVREYLENGGSPSKSVTETLGLDEDFIYDSQEALKNPESDSAKVFETSVDKIVNQRVQQMLSAQQEQNKQEAALRARAEEEKVFKEKHKMSDEEFANMMEDSKKHIMSLEDIHLLLNKDTIKANTAKSTKKEMVDQMKNVRNIPTSASGANSAQQGEKSLEDNVFDALKGADDIEDLFG